MYYLIENPEGENVSLSTETTDEDGIECYVSVFKSIIALEDFLITRLKNLASEGNAVHQDLFDSHFVILNDLGRDPISPKVVSEISLEWNHFDVK